ncbi:D-3-phosphoglycerate dehydrogenase [Sphingobium sp. PNB]|uniref:NAD(P)-dependent oxidoreductase n=1 Tax=Sphingobium sp. PNB TaxID=863934 RepID=UPI001CA3F86C|nr:NAD(P)-dependent oxidoreductase [Sphingobium sp. PNB]MCB4860966.1 D-3-phosphoglycerate dehydrogenase [Sphingobium sp. PNB]
MHILITGPAGSKAFLEQLARAIDSQAAQIVCRYDLERPSDYENWQEVEILVAFARPCDHEDMQRAPHLRAIVLPSLGFEGIDVDAATRRGIAVANGHVAENFETVAEAAILFILMSLYDIEATQVRLKRDLVRVGPPRARMLKGKTIGILGFGNIARAVVKRLEGWDVDMLIHTRRHVGVAVAEQCDLETLLERSDVVVPLLPLTAETHGILSKERLLSMKEGAILVNLSRGAIIDEGALCDPEVVARLGGIALDVFENEPLPSDSPLRGHPRAILTNHEVAHTSENLSALFATAVTNVQAAMKGSIMPTILNR